MNSKDFLSTHPTAVPVLDLAKFIGVEATGIRKKAARLNGQVNFDPSADAFSPEQLKAFLPEYLTGQRQLKGVKRRAVESLLKALGGPVESQVKISGKTADGHPAKRENQQTKTSGKTTTERIVNALFGWLEEMYSLRSFAFVAALCVIFWQAGHFATLEAAESPGDTTFDWLSSWGIALGFESLVLLITMNSDKRDWRTWAWLTGFALIATFVNLCFYDVIEWRIWRKLILSVALPFSIFAITHLYLQKSKR